MTPRRICLLVLVAAVALGLTVATDGLQAPPVHAQAVTLYLAPTELEIREGESLSYSVVLGSQPSGAVTVDLTNVDSDLISLNRTSLTFNRGNWNSPKFVAVTAP